MIQLLPVELQRHCIHFIRDVSTLRSLRLVSKAGAAVATDALFSTIAVFPDNDSGKKCEHIVKDENLNALVRTVVFHTSLPNQLLFDNDIFVAWQASLRLLPDFQRVTAVQLKFAQECSLNPNMHRTYLWKKSMVEGISFRTTILTMLFTWVAKAKNIDSLTIKNLQCYTEEEVFRSQEFPQVMGRLKQLHLLGTIEGSYEGASLRHPEHLNMRARSDFFSTGLFSHWLCPVQDQLTHLTLYMMCYWGIKPFCDLRPVVFPNLRSLALGKLTLAYGWQVDWILSHAERLESLILDDCPIVLALFVQSKEAMEKWPAWDRKVFVASLLYPGYLLNSDLRWDHVLTRFCDGLPKLKHFAMGHGDWPEQTMFEERYELPSKLEQRRYVLHNSHLEPNPWIEGGKVKSSELVQFYFKPEFPGDEEDGQALRKLTGVVQERLWSCTD